MSGMQGASAKVKQAKVGEVGRTRSREEAVFRILDSKPDNVFEAGGQSIHLCKVAQ